MQVERFSQEDSGERVSNALVTCPEAGDTGSKGPLIPHNVSLVREARRNPKGTLGGTCVHQLVGRVVAYQGDDG